MLTHLKILPVILFAALLLIAPANAAMVEGEKYDYLDILRAIDGKLAYRSGIRCSSQTVQKYIALAHVLPWVVNSLYSRSCPLYLHFGKKRKRLLSPSSFPSSLNGKFSYIVNNNDGKESRLYINGRKEKVASSIGIYKESTPSILIIDEKYYVFYKGEYYGPYKSVVNAQIFDNKLFFTVVTGSRYEPGGDHYFDGEKLETDYDIKDYIHVAYHNGKIVYVGDKDGQRFVVHGDLEYGPYDEVANFTSSEERLVWIAKTQDGEFVVVDGKVGNVFEAVHSLKISGRNILYVGEKNGREYFVLNNDPVEYSKFGVRAAIRRFGDAYYDELYKNGNPVLIKEGKLIVNNTAYKLYDGLQDGYIHSGDIKRLNHEFHSPIAFSVIKIGKNFLWINKDDGKSVVTFKGKEIGRYDELGLFRIIGGRVVFSAQKDGIAGIVINGKEYMEYDMPESRWISGSGVNKVDIVKDPYVPIDIEGRVAFIAYKDGKYFTVEETGDSSVLNDEDIDVRVLDRPSRQ